ncbi:hypothetical protein JTE90_028158 [Oedothorax gibbosus]|uniref:Protein jagunal n=1 Tax=Oedothorax gibbosus TaxID=931172 RepID=A0AAV6VBM4_9ARAC|nr:hypothetical protein JTE90_028158 [Oedothorax gibbosus]
MTERSVSHGERMAARGGARAKGTDGSDFGHRETVASHYQISSTNKKRLKVCMFFHTLAFLFILAKSSAEILKFFDISLKALIKIDIPFPKPALWEYVWLTSIVFTFAAYLAFRRNNILAMQVYVGSTFVTGICPLVTAIIYHSGDLKVFLAQKIDENVEKFYGIPVVLILSVFVSVTFLVHSLSMMFGMNLIRAWTPKKGKKKA